MDKKMDKDKNKDKKWTWDRPVVIVGIIGVVIALIGIIITVILTTTPVSAQDSGYLCIYGVAKNGNCNQPCNYLVSVNDDNGDCKPIHNKKGDGGDDV